MSATSRDPIEQPDASPRGWTFLSNHAHVLIYLATEDDPTLRDIAQHVGITERAVLMVLADLENEGLIRRTRVGRRNHYDLRLDQPLRHPLEAHRTVRQLIRLVTHGRRR